jgi:hypothetical protein
MVGDTGRHLIVAGGGTIYCLVPTPVEEQVRTTSRKRAALH